MSASSPVGMPELPRLSPLRRRIFGILWVFALAVVSTIVAVSPASAKEAGAVEQGDGWWHSGYWVDYGLIAFGGAGYFLRHMEPTSSALIGVVYDPNDPAAVLDSKFSDRIGRTHLEEGDGETVSTAAATVLVAAGAGYIAVEQGLKLFAGAGARSDRARLAHDTFVGYLETVALSSGLNSVLKNVAGRLRPDFQDRVRRWHCPRGELDAVHCPAGIQPLSDDAAEAEKIWFDGRRSFFSGHSVSALNFAGYLSLSIGGQYVWGAGATPTSRSLGLAAQTLLMTTGVFVATSRFDDGRHHLGDVLTGSIFGLAVANFSYWRRFGADGRPRERAAADAVTVQLQAGPGDAGLALHVRY